MAELNIQLDGHCMDGIERRSLYYDLASDVDGWRSRIDSGNIRSVLGEVKVCQVAGTVSVK